MATLEEEGRTISVSLSPKTLVGRGRDGFIYKLPNIYTDLTMAEGYKWPCTWVVKIPRYLLTVLSQPYMSAVSNSLTGSQADQKAQLAVAAKQKAQLAMAANAKQELWLQDAIWRYLSHDYLPYLKFPTTPWDFDKVHVKKLKVDGVINEESLQKNVEVHQLLESRHCLLMPLATMDAFQALINHYTDNLLINFCRDILVQLMYLEEQNIVHGDLKLSNILLFEGNRKNYVFVLADFWDSFRCDAEGRVEDLNPQNPMRRLVAWKFHTEKFGTRLYKDPFLLQILRKAKQLNKFSFYQAVSGINPGKVNIWSFGVVVSFILCSKMDGEILKKKIKGDVLYSGKLNNKPPLGATDAVERLRTLLKPYLKGEGKGDKAGRIRVKAESKSEVALFKDRLKSLILEGIVTDPGKRLNAKEIYTKLSLNSRLLRKDRDITQDLRGCHRSECKMCHPNPDYRFN